MKLIVAGQEAVTAFEFAELALGIDVELIPGALSSAACTNADPDLFFPEDGDELSARRAKRICGACPVRAACLAGALARGEEYGIFGGLTAEERGMPKTLDIGDDDVPVRTTPAARTAPSPEVVDAMRWVGAFVTDITQQVRREQAAAGIAPRRSGRAR